MYRKLFVLIGMSTLLTYYVEEYLVRARRAMAKLLVSHCATLFLLCVVHVRGIALNACARL